jgi:U3 small nucleolar RNA-associated protein 13
LHFPFESVSNTVTTHYSPTMSKQQDLKEASDGLSKVWKVQDSHEPFYSGGHCEVVLAPSSSNSSSTHTDHDLLACMYEDNIKLMNWATGQHELTLLPEGAADEDTDNAEKVSTFCMHPSGQELVLATPQGLLRHFSCRVKESVTDAEKREAQALVAAAPTGASVNSSSSSNNSKAPAWEFVRAIKAHTMPVLTMAYDSTGTLVATGSADRSVKVWDVSRGYCTHSFKGHTDVVQLVQFHIPASFYIGGGSGGGGGGGGGNLQLYSTSHDYTLKIYDLNDSTCVSTFKEHLSVATALATASASGDEYLLASVGRDKVRSIYYNSFYPFSSLRALCV